MTVLDEIYAHKRLEVAQIQARIPLQHVRDAAEAAPLPPDFQAALQRPPGSRPRLIAEVKKASPSKGLLLADFDPTNLASIYRQNGAAAVSVLTDTRYFQGSLEDLIAVAAQTPRIPVLRKEFIFDPYQIYEARAAGASAILLIAAMLDRIALRDLFQLARNINLAVLIEVHNQPELEIALLTGSELVGVNNRNLHDLKVDLRTTFDLRPHVPSSVWLVAESGIRTRADVDRLTEVNVDAILVGEAIVTAVDIAAKVRELAQ